MSKENRAEIIKNLRRYSSPCEFFIKEGIPRYLAKHNGDGRQLYINIRRAFNEILGYPVGIHAGKYKDKILGVHIMALTNALRKLEKEGMVKRRSQGIWIWVGNGGKNEQKTKQPTKSN